MKAIGAFITWFAVGALIMVGLIGMALLAFKAGALLR